ncbi:hypothetical protein [Mucilaginibacter sp. AK015]|uniref:hypothetical protein n=1 Tax=Mucilaginibacter sp. AK015 TaxID=2723072 RepID=UPI00160A74E0|nr:hypothetical protein [Mucilaginibacter sp. AK015]MBB5395230.1 hypothetical protein [Mucilaginibacter sp. AK015]
MYKQPTNKPDRKPRTVPGGQQGTGRGVLLVDKRDTVVDASKRTVLIPKTTVGSGKGPGTVVDNRPKTVVEQTLQRGTARALPLKGVSKTLTKPVIPVQTGVVKPSEKSESAKEPERLFEGESKPVTADKSEVVTKKHGPATEDPGLVNFVHELHAYLESMGPFTEDDRAGIEALLGRILEGYPTLSKIKPTLTANILGGIIFYGADDIADPPSQEEQLAQKHLQPMNTLGDGNCSIHALLGEDKDGTLICDAAQQTRETLADHYQAGTLHPHAMAKMDLARQITIRKFANNLLTDHTEGMPSIAATEDDPKEEEGSNEKKISDKQLKENLLKAIHQVNAGHYAQSVTKKVQDTTFNDMINGVTGDEVLGILKAGGILSEDDTVAAPDLSPQSVEAILPANMKHKAESIYWLLKPYIKGKINSNAFVERALQNDAVKQAYIALLRSQHHWLNAEQLQALAIQHGKSIQLFENDLMGGLQETDPFNVADDRPLIKIYSSGSHFERLGPLQADAVPARERETTDDEASAAPAEADPFQNEMYNRARTQYHKEFRGQKRITTENYRARKDHGLGHGIRVAASVLRLVNVISQKHKFKFPLDTQHLKALSMAALWHDAANNSEDDKLAENKQGDLFVEQLQKDGKGKLHNKPVPPAYQWAADCLKLKGKISVSKKPWDQLTAEEQGAAIIAGADSYEYIRTYQEMKKKYSSGRNVLVNTNAMGKEEDEAHLEAVIGLIQGTGGNTRGGAPKGTNPEDLAVPFEYHGIQSLMDPENPITKAFARFAGKGPKGPANILGLLHSFSADMPLKRPSTPVVKQPVKTGTVNPDETADKKVEVEVVRKTSSPALKPVINFTPRDDKRTRIPASQNSDGSYNQGIAPLFKAGRGTAPAPVDVGKTLALVHGISTQHIPGAFKNGFLSSAYTREGPHGNYSRDADKNGGGGLAVYTRAVGTKHTSWPAFGQGVGSSISKAQIVLRPKILIDIPAWRHSSTDLKGKAPGVTDKMIGDKTLDSFDLWEQQSESGRNSAFNSTVNNPGGLANNEQIFWHQIPLAGNVIAIICKTEQHKKDIIESIGGSLEEGCIFHKGEKIPVVVASDGATLAKTLPKKTGAK